MTRTTGRAILDDWMNLGRDLGLDADDRVELLVAVELACRLELTSAEAQDIVSVGDLVRRMEDKQSAVDTALRESIKDLAAGASAFGQPIDITAAASDLAARHRGTSMDLPTIQAALARALMKAR